ncbi:MBL fold metallo-hydrolase [Pseudomonas frederiksbergensis]|uniref:MBL fold metallo-hydrolase n=1 Tax=Pseudomonas frederiksbergensis TaxID=104087 RepID=UPI003D03C523
MRLITLLILLCIAGCTQDVAELKLPTTQNTNLKGPKLIYLGVGGWLVRWRNQALLFAPSFSNPSFPPILVSPDHERIDRYMPKASDVTVLLIGHSHYDHLLDVPWVMHKYTPHAKAYGPETAGHILAAARPRLNFENVEPVMAQVTCDEDGETHCNAAKAGTWISFGPFRFMPIESKHAPHVLGIDLLPGAYCQDLSTFPRTVWGWKEGTTLAWLVDLVDETGKTVYRIHYQDSASNPPMGFPPISIDTKRVDVEILAAASWSQVNQYPSALLKVTRPRLLALGHWEDFFGNDPYKPEVSRLQKEPALIKTICETNPQLPVVMPYPLTDVPFPAPDSTELRGPEGTCGSR